MNESELNSRLESLGRAVKALQADNRDLQLRVSRLVNGRPMTADDDFAELSRVLQQTRSKLKHARFMAAGWRRLGAEVADNHREFTEACLRKAREALLGEYQKVAELKEANERLWHQLYAVENFDDEERARFEELCAGVVERLEAEHERA